MTYNLSVGDPEQEEDPKNPNDDLFITDLVHFLIRFILRGGMTHSHISPTAPSCSMHTWAYIYKHAGECSCNLGMDKVQYVEDQPINTNHV